jgi:hypothetical protein
VIGFIALMDGKLPLNYRSKLFHLPRTTPPFQRTKPPNRARMQQYGKMAGITARNLRKVTAAKEMADLK